MGMKQAKSQKKGAREEVGATKLSLDEEAIEFDGSDDDRKKKQTSKRKRKSSNADDGSSSNIKDDPSNNPTTKADRHAQKKSAKAQLKLQLQSQIPTHDPETGVPYNKIQVRRMMRRVKHGLSPIPTEEEELEIRTREKRERMEEEALMYAERRNDDDVDASNTEDDDAADADADDANSDGGEIKLDEQDDASFSDESNDNNEEEDDANNDGDGKDAIDARGTTNTAAAAPPTKKAKRSKPVPPDYICQACQNKPQSSASFVPHWIYDCPVKKTQRGCNQVSKKLRGLHDPASHKVFVSGLPFECNEGMVKRFFEESIKNNNDEKNANVAVAELVHCKLLKFEDSNRCKGQAFLTFDSEEGATTAIRVMNGSIWKEIVEPGMATKGKKKTAKSSSATTSEGGAKKELKLKVTKALNRFVTKKKMGKIGAGR
ncbi:hypothetical protein ACHAWU_001901 [Discostella pseudostelligera]|uniref:RRM domain-containing protein n=1 Tax=Discostella pseudostelligera TaxID=259834 RepID=A0ABD3MWB1_9STRA